MGVFMARVALLTMSDGRDFVARDLTDFCHQAENDGGGRPGARGSPGRPRRRAGQRQPRRNQQRSPSRRRPARPDDLQLSGLGIPPLHDAAAGATTGPAAALLATSTRIPGHGRHARGRRRARPDRPLHSRAWGDIDDPAVVATLERIRAPGPRSARCGARHSAGSAAGQWACIRRSPTLTSGSAVRGRRRGDRPIRARAPGASVERGRVADGGDGSSSTRRPCTTTATC